MNINGLIHLLKNDKKCNFVAMAITPHQMIGVEAVIRYLTEHGKKLYGYILVTNHPDTGGSLDKANLKYHSDNIKYLNFSYSFPQKDNRVINNIKVKFDMFKTIFCNIKKTGAFYFVWTEVVNNIVYAINKAQNDRKIIFIKIDDGAASYQPPFEYRLSYLLVHSKNIYEVTKAYIKAYLFSITTFLFENCLRKQKAFIDATLFWRVVNNGKMHFVKNKMFTQYYRDAFVRENANFNGKGFENAVVVNSQCFVESGITDGKVDYDIYSQLAKVLSDMGEKVIIKPHPREKNVARYRELGWKIYEDNHFSQEEILANLTVKPKAIIGFYSSTLLNAVGLFNIQVISLANIALQENISPVFRKELVSFKRNYNHCILFPKNWNQLCEMLVK